jgi:hypothetical protein
MGARRITRIHPHSRDGILPEGHQPALEGFEHRRDNQGMLKLDMKIHLSIRLCGAVW